MNLTISSLQKKIKEPRKSLISEEFTHFFLFGEKKYLLYHGFSIWNHE